MTNKIASAFSGAGGAVRVLITRPAQQSEALLERFEASGVSAVSVPMLQTEALGLLPQKNSSVKSSPETNFLAAQSIAILRRLSGEHGCAEDLPSFSKVLFVSANAVKYTAKALNYFGDARYCLLNSIPCLGMGKASSEAIREQGWLLDSDAAGELPEAYTSETLLNSRWAEQLVGQSLLICRGCGGRGLLVDGLSERGISVSILEAYRRIRPHYSSDLKRALLNWLFDPGVHFERLVLLGSQEAAENFLSLVVEALGEAELATDIETDVLARAVRGGSGRQNFASQHAEALCPCSFVVPSERVAASLLKQLSQHPKLEMMLFGQLEPESCTLVAENAGDQAMLHATLSRIKKGLAL